MAKIKEIGKVVTGKTPSTQNEDFWNGNIPFITPTDLLGIAEVKNTERHISEEGLKSIKNNSISGISVLVGCIGSDMGNVAYTEQTCATNQQINAITDINKTINPLFIYYYLSNKKALFQQLAGKTTTPILSKSDFEEIEIPIPIKETQDNIVSILSAIDDKIANNNAICAELEAMAKLLYDYWFVQFDFPDENGKPYKSSGGKMVWSEELKREIPEGWKVCSLSSICETKLGGTPDTSNPNYWNGSIPWLNSGEVAISPVLNSAKTITNLGMENSATAFANAGAVVMSITRYIRPSILGMDACFNQSVVAVIPNEIYHTAFLYPFMLSQVNRYMGLRTGAQQPHINKEVVDNTLIICPSKDVLYRYYSLAENLYEAQLLSAQESQKLTSLRDFLLPLLMNGQVVINSDK